ncbi:hypothetical protein GALMADRAFT_881145 [Galerina marginata CBS 339.88]|uniref:Uncharacterized protein n=1 Tax=Galerina marginata (strain CBS 339.88) TaxID=685588 RepID=A0A067SV83_GALM3|nr:hypothetical protein GALMADRAFT_881145 [Galerina marginata CBS 339.88]
MRHFCHILLALAWRGIIKGPVTYFVACVRFHLPEDIGSAGLKCLKPKICLNFTDPYLGSISKKNLPSYRNLCVLGQCGIRNGRYTGCGYTFTFELVPSSIPLFRCRALVFLTVCQKILGKNQWIRNKPNRFTLSPIPASERKAPVSWLDRNPNWLTIRTSAPPLKLWHQLIKLAYQSLLGPVHLIVGRPHRYLPQIAFESHPRDAKVGPVCLNATSRSSPCATTVNLLKKNSSYLK